MNIKIRSHLALFSVATIYGVNYTVAREVMRGGYVEPLGFILLRVIMGAGMFWLISMLLPKERIQRSDFRLIILCGLFGTAINQMFFFSGLKYTTPINASLIMTVTPLMVLLAAAFILSERITFRKLIGLLIGLLGAIIVIGYGQAIAFSLESLQGDIMVLINAISFGIYLVLVKSLMKRYQTITVLKWVFTVGTIIVLPFGIGDLSVVEWSTFPLPIWGAIAFVLIMTTCVAYLLNAFALKHLRASVVGIYIFLQPVIATAVALLAGRDELSGFKIIAAILIFTGVYLVSKAPQMDTASKVLNNK